MTELLIQIIQDLVGLSLPSVRPGCSHGFAFLRARAGSGKKFVPIYETTRLSLARESPLETQLNSCFLSDAAPHLSTFLEQNEL